MVITCMKKKAKIKSNSIQNVTMVTCREKRVKIKSNSPQNRMWITCRQKRANIKSSTVQNIMVIDHLYAEEGGDKVQDNTEHDGDHL